MKNVFSPSAAFRCIFAGVAFGAPVVLPAQVVVVYAQSFTNTTAGNLPLSDYGWSGARSRGASETSGGGSSTVVTGLEGVATGAGSAVFENVNALSPHGDNLEEGFVFMGTDGNNSTRFIFSVPTTGMGDWATGGALLAGLASVDWGQRNQSATARTRLAIQIDGDWYATVADFTNPSAATWTTHTLSITPSTEWHPLALQGNGSSDALATDTTVTTSTITGTVGAIGLYAWSPSGNNVRFDSFVVSAIPEPSTYAALFGLAALGLVFHRRRARPARAPRVS